jgi:two-component system LytT family response regulator
MKIMNVVIVDDEKEVSKALELLLKKTCPNVRIKAIVHNAIDAAKELKKGEIELLFLDIEMPGGSGFDLLELLNGKKPYTIFTTAYSEYAIKAIKAGAGDYILKPIDPDELIMAVKKAEQHLSNKSQNEGKGQSRTITIATTKQVFLLDKKDVIYLKADGRYTQVVCINGTTHLVCRNIGEFEEELLNDFFFRVHKSYLVNCKHVSKISSADGGFAVMSNATEIEISKRRKAEFLKYVR